MQIKSLFVNAYVEKKLGLREIELPGLDRLVVLVGENGCGKTRMLAYVDWWLRQAQRIGTERMSSYVSEAKKQREFAAALANHDGDPMTLAGVKDDCDTLAAMSAPMDGIKLSLTEGEDADSSLALYCKLADSLNGTGAVPDVHGSALSLGLPRGASDVDRFLATHPLMYVHDICDRYLEESKRESLGFYSRDPGVERSFEDLQKLVYTVSALTLKLSNKGEALLNDRLVSTSQLSKGQLALLRIAVLVHSKILDDFGVPILFDEPELHLHPRTLTSLFDLLLQRLPRSQIWVATHSLALTAHLAVQHPRSIWFGKEGKFVRAGRNPEDVVNGLLGGTGGAAEIADFCKSVDQFALASFAAECLVPPIAVTYKDKDEQIAQIQSLISDSPQKPVCILDFGAGQARLLEGLVLSCRDRGIKLGDEISYYAIEPDEKWREICKQQVALYYDDGSERVFESIHAIRGKVEVDFVVLANVLHEIKIDAWLSDVFGEEGVKTVLKSTGFVVIVEDTQLPQGELAHAAGYLILEQSALRVLFSVTEESPVDFKMINSQKYGKRLQATAIRGALLANVTQKTIAEALKTQQKLSLDVIRKLRENGIRQSYDSGRQHAYHAQLVVNTILASEVASAISKPVSEPVGE